MAVFVDDMFKYPLGQFRRMKMSHMIADTEEELHAMADKIGLARRWYQGDHYDVSMTLRKLAVEAGAVEITLEQCSAMSMNRREGYPLGTPETALEARKAVRAVRQEKRERAEAVAQAVFSNLNPFDVKVDHARQIITIQGVPYAFDLFNTLAFGQIGAQFEIGRRDPDGCVMLTRISA